LKCCALYPALQIREAFQRIYTAENTEEFEGLLNHWYYWATHSQLAPIIKVAQTIKRHWDGIISWKKSQINNGATFIMGASSL
jgi:transposase